jgi:ABC-type multidrug transport system fused ATPase/permease subunit
LELKCDGKKGLSVSYQNLSFSYRNEEEGKVVEIKNLDLDIKEGELVLIKGPSGIGKTTLINLLLRFYDPIEGQVLINGQNIKELNFDYRKEISVCS